MAGRRIPSGVLSLIRVGLARAEHGLSTLLALSIAIDVDVITLEPVLGLGRLAGSPEEEVVGIYVGFSGDLAGHCLLCLESESARHLAATLLGEAPGTSDLVDSALLEAGNITVSGLVNGLADSGGWRIQISPPVLARDMLGALLGTVLAAVSLSANELLAVRGRFRSDSSDPSGAKEIAGTLLLLPDAGSLRALMGDAR